MRVLTIIAVACVAGVAVGCAAGEKEESLFPDDAPARTAAAPMDEPIASAPDDGETAPGVHRFTVKVPAIADGVIELNIAETSKRKIDAAMMVLLDETRKPIIGNTKGWLTARVTRGKTYYADVYADPDGGEVKLLSSFKPVVDDFEPNDDAASARELEAGKASQVRLFAGLDKGDGIDADFFTVKTKGKERISLQLVNGSSGGSFCVDVTTSAGESVGSTCSSGDIDASFKLAAPSSSVIVKLTGTNGPDASTLTITPN